MKKLNILDFYLSRNAIIISSHGTCQRGNFSSNYLHADVFEVCIFFLSFYFFSSSSMDDNCETDEEKFLRNFGTG